MSDPTALALKALSEALLNLSRQPVNVTVNNYYGGRDNNGGHAGEQSFTSVEAPVVKPAEDDSEEPIHADTPLRTPLGGYAHAPACGQDKIADMIVSDMGGQAMSDVLTDTPPVDVQPKRARPTQNTEAARRRYAEVLPGKSYADAKRILESEGYKIHILYVGNGTKQAKGVYDPQTVGVRIASTPHYNFRTRELEDTSVKVTQVVDIGGVDRRNVGMTNPATAEDWNKLSETGSTSSVLADRSGDAEDETPE